MLPWKPSKTFWQNHRYLAIAHARPNRELLTPTLSLPGTQQLPETTPPILPHSVPQVSHHNVYHLSSPGLDTSHTRSAFISSTTQ